MKLVEKFMDKNEYSRPGRFLKSVKSIVIHWTGGLGHSANQVWNFFNKDCPKLKKYSSAQFIIDFDGTILQCMPETEFAYHCGSSQIDPASGKVYTDLAREKLGDYASNKMKSPNQVSIGIELCALNENGDFTPETLTAGAELVAMLLKKYNLTVDDITTHNLVVGWKNCPKLFTDHPEEFDNFKNKVSELL